jgi:hypothetical protein
MASTPGYSRSQRRAHTQDATQSIGPFRHRRRTRQQRHRHGLQPPDFCQAMQSVGHAAHRGQSGQQRRRNHDDADRHRVAVTHHRCDAAIRHAQQAVLAVGSDVDGERRVVGLV